MNINSQTFFVLYVRVCDYSYNKRCAENILLLFIWNEQEGVGDIFEKRISVLHLHHNYCHRPFQQRCITDIPSLEDELQQFFLIELFLRDF